MTCHGGFIWYELMTDDADKARAFYKDVIGWDIGAGSDMPGDMDYRMIHRSDGGMAGGMLVMDEGMKANGPPPCWIGYVDHPDVDAAVMAIEEAGGTCHMGPQTMEGVGRMAMVADPQGAMIYVMSPTPPADDPDAQSDVFSVDKPQHCRWNQLQTSDPDGALELYQRLFGWKQEGSMPMSELGDYRFIQHGDTGIGAVMPLMDDVDRPVWSYFFGVDDIDRAAKAVVAGGGRLDHPIEQIPGGEYSTHCFDPQGAGFGIVGPRKE